MLTPYKKALQDNLIDEKHYNRSNIIETHCSIQIYKTYGYNYFPRYYDNNPNYDKFSSMCILTRSIDTLLWTMPLNFEMSAFYIPIDMDVLNLGDLLPSNKDKFLTLDNSLEDVLRQSREIPTFDIQTKYHKYGTEYITLNNQIYKRVEIPKILELDDISYKMGYTFIFIEFLIPLYRVEYKDIELDNVMYYLQNCKLSRTTKNLIYNGKNDFQ